MYFLAILCPPLAALICGGFWSFVANLVLCCLFLFPGWIHALVVVADYKAKKRHEEILFYQKHWKSERETGVRKSAPTKPPPLPSTQDATPNISPELKAIFKGSYRPRRKGARGQDGAGRK